MMPVNTPCSSPAHHNVQHVTHERGHRQYLLGYNQVLDCVRVEGAAGDCSVGTRSLDQHSMLSILTQQPFHMELLPGFKALIVGKAVLVNYQECLEFGGVDQHIGYSKGMKWLLDAVLSSWISNL